MPVVLPTPRSYALPAWHGLLRVKKILRPNVLRVKRKLKAEIRSADKLGLPVNEMLVSNEVILPSNRSRQRRQNSIARDITIPTPLTSKADRRRLRDTNARGWHPSCPPALLLPPAGQMTANRQRTRQFRLESSFRRCRLDDNLREWPEWGGSSFEPCPDDQRFAHYRLHPARDTG